MRSVPSCCWVALALFSVLSPDLGAQDHPNVAKGFWADHAFDLGGIDHVNEFSGNLILTIPLGQTYRADGELSYRLSLVYDGQVWDAREGAPGTTAVKPSAIWNAGMGFLVTLGRILPANSSLNPDDELLYLSPDGAKRRFFEKLHPEDTDEDAGFQFTRYTRDGSYLRLRVTGNPATGYELDFPDGSTHLFNAQGILEWIVGPYLNALHITYDLDELGNETWSLDDGFRQHEVKFELRTIDGAARQMVKQVRLAAFGGTTANYDFSYASTSVLRSCPDTDPATGTNASIQFLTGVTLPDGSSYSMPLATSYITAPAAADCRLSAALKRLQLPTLGALEWDLGPVFLPEESVSDEDGNRKLHWSRPIGVLARRMVKDNLDVEGTWYYVHQLGPRDPEPNPAPPRWKKTTIITPLGDQEEHFFSVWPEDFPPPAGGWDNTEYGLPFTREFVDGASSTFLSTRTSDCDPNPDFPTSPLNCVLLRSTWVRYSNDTETSSLPLEDEAYRNQRLAATKTIFHDDGDKYAQVDSSDDDGLGHYRTEVRSGNFPSGSSRTAIQSFNPDRLSYPGAGWTEIAPTAPWVLGTSTSRTVSETSESCAGASALQSAREDYCFDSETGVLLASRTRKLSSGAISSDDVLRIWKRDLITGNVTSELWAGGDGSGLSTALSVCQLAQSTPSTSFRVNHTYSFGSRATSNYTDDDDVHADPAELQFLFLDREIDSNTGLPSAVRDVATLETVLIYDSLGRLSQVKPNAGNGAAWEEFTHSLAQGGDPFVGAKVFHKVYQNGAFVTVLLDEKAEFDDFGRIHRESRKRGSGYDSRFTFYNQNGWKTFVSEWGSDSGSSTGEYGVENSEFDPFGRPSAILRYVLGRTPATEFDFDYLGEREIVRTFKVGSTLLQDGEIGAADSTTTERYDHYGRLVQIEEPSGDGGTLVLTSYGYDVGNRLRKAHTASSPEQNRCWEYDQRGFLASEQHPEKGATGNGTVTYSGFDPMGHARQKSDGGVDLGYTFDRAGRLTQVKDLHGAGSGDDQLLKEWRFGTPLSTPDRLGRLETAIGLNFPVVNGTPITARIEETFSYLEPGGRLGNRFVRMCYGTASCTAENAVDAYTHSEDFDARGQRTGITYPVCDPVLGNPTNCPVSSRVVRNVVNSYDLGFLTSVQGWANSITYHPSGLWDSITHSNSVIDKQLLSLDRRGRPKLLTSTRGAVTLWRSGTYRYDPAGNIIGLGQTAPYPGEPDESATVIFPDENGGVDRFLYDPVQRLTGSWLALDNSSPTGCVFCDDFELGSTCLWSAEDPPANCADALAVPEVLRRSQRYKFDEYGNIQKIWTDGVLHETPTSKATNRLDAPAAVYDARGNLTSWSLTNFTYDALNRMVRREVDTEPEYHFLYTADDERILYVIAQSNGNLEFHWTLRDFARKVLREYVSTPAALVPTHDYIFRGDQPLGEVDFTTPSPTTYHLTLDHLGTPRLKTNTAGGVVQKWKYFPFGEEAIPSAQAGTALRFTGHERDRFNLGGIADDVDYMHARFESPPTGRFLSIDRHSGSIQFPQTWNRYCYAANSPLKFVDRDGNEIGSAYDAWDSLLASGAISMSEHEDLGRASARANSFGASGGLLSLGVIAGGWAAVDVVASKLTELGILGSGSVVLGETMRRVGDAASQLGARTFETAATEISVMMQENMVWLRGAIDKGARIFDIGINAAREGGRSPFYQQEIATLVESGYQQVFVRYIFVQGQLTKLYEWVRVGTGK